MSETLRPLVLAARTADRLGVPALSEPGHATPSPYGLSLHGLSLPASLMRVGPLGLDGKQWVGIALALFSGYVIAFVVVAAITRTAAKVASRTKTRADDALAEGSRRPLEVIVWALVARVLLEPLQLPDSALRTANHAAFSLFVIGGAWLALRALDVAMQWFDERALAGGASKAARADLTETMIFRRVAGIAVKVLAVALLLVQFEGVRSAGVSILASAGVLSIIMGFAAQRALAGIVGGIQFAIARPTHVGHTVSIEGEFGEIESLTLTYAVVKLLDGRRLVLPVTHFLEKPFYDWTRAGKELLGSVAVAVDYGAPAAPFQAELERICAEDSRWDGRVCELQVTGSDGESTTLCAFVSAASPLELSDLRCAVREQLLAFVRKFEAGRYVPRSRSQEVLSAGT
jgi:small-conductance mechanosensitive channel